MRVKDDSSELYSDPKDETRSQPPTTQPASVHQLRAVWLGAAMNDQPEERLREAGCKLQEFKSWAVDVFRMTEARERLTDVLVCLDGDANTGEVVLDEVTWSQRLTEARTRRPEALETIVQCISVVEEVARGTGLQNRIHFRDLTFTSQSTNTQRENAYGLFHGRSAAEASVMIEEALGDNTANMLVNRIPGTKIGQADLNYEATNPFDGDSDEFGVVRTPAFDAVQRWLAAPKPGYNDYAAANWELKKMLGKDAQIVERLPNRRSEDPHKSGHVRKGDTHKPHQVTGLFWSLMMELQYGVFANADGCGAGKTHSYLSHLVASTEYWATTDNPVRLPTMLLCPRTLLEKTFEDAYDQLGLGWKVYYYGQDAGPSKLRLTFDQRHDIFTSADAARSVVVVTFNQLQACSEASNASRTGLFDRIIIDEAQSIRRCDVTKQGRILKSFQPRFKCLYTGSPVVDTIQDLDGYLAFLQSDHWSSEQDLNRLAGPADRLSRYALFKLGLNSQDIAATATTTARATDSTWIDKCPSVLGLTEAQITAKVQTGWRCSHWPACLKHNTNRAQSMERKLRKANSKPSLLSADTEPPFEENPYDEYHPDNLNKLRCCTTRAFRWYITPHLSKVMQQSDLKIVGQRVKVILDILFLSRSLYSETTMPDGSKLQVAAEIPDATIFTQELRLSADELEAYEAREATCSKLFVGELTPEKVSKMSDEAGRKQLGSKFAKLSVLSTHVGLSGLEGVSTAVLRCRRAEGLPLLVARMKAKGALNPEDMNQPLSTAHEVLRQFLWGSPKMRYLLWEIQRVILAGNKRSTHRKLLLFVQFPRSAEMVLKVSSRNPFLYNADLTARSISGYTCHSSRHHHVA